MPYSGYAPGLCWGGKALLTRGQKLEYSCVLRSALRERPRRHWPGKACMAKSPTAKFSRSETANPPSNVPGAASLSGLLLPARLDRPDLLHQAESLGPRPPLTGDGQPEPYSLQWFLDIEHQRHQRYGRWLPSTLEFNKHASETILVMGAGLGTDWVQFARAGANVVVCSPSTEQLEIVRRNFEQRQLAARFLHASPAQWPIDPSTIDIVYLTDLLHRYEDAQPLAEEVYRVLKAGGKVMATTPAHYDVDFWRRILLPWRWRLGTRQSKNHYTARTLRGLFHRFVEHRVHKRHLRRGDVPHLWRLLPTSMLQRLLGRTLVLKAFKPLSAAMSVPMAA